MRVACCLLSVCFLASCSSVNYVGIETYNPAEITFPGNVGKILVVNNAVHQPDDVGCEFTLFGDKVDTCRVKADSALFYACSGLGKAMADISFFNDVLLYHDAVRKDDVYYEDKKLTQDQVQDLCDETGTDAVVSIDRLLFESKKNIMAYAEGYVGGEIQVKISGVVRGYLPGRPNPLATVYVTDSVFFNEEAPNLILLDKFLPSSENALRASAEYIGMKTSPNFVPHWNNETRWFYTGMGTKWKEASAYAQSEKWDKAVEYWEHLYEKSGGWKAKAKAASNIALGYEMKTKLDEAYEWANKSAELFKKGEGEDGKNTKLLALYVEVLRNRVRSDKKLNMQFGE
ncbi:DUF6340 family protein [uncultured Parabacteroides sp.]|uniref:DUF6340 family protein n=1 Tax=uncultured Parabacteroides sp. TaxID=512312 RepID=UPI00259B174A|nr:DUF6340 family protein [uncultured Parabacteroides sp.]